MSWGTCYSSSNNIHFDYPPLMDDGRLYKEAYFIDNKLKEKFNIKNNYDYRQFLQKNSNSIIDINQCNVINNKNTSINNQNSQYGYEESDLKNIYLSRNFMNNKINGPRFYIDK
tara:strand:- start:8323 stop:8664 length:342 start_codon:yes stop_codon:yes gene_type:complete